MRGGSTFGTSGVVSDGGLVVEVNELSSGRRGGWDGGTPRSGAAAPEANDGQVATDGPGAAVGAGVVDAVVCRSSATTASRSLRPQVSRVSTVATRPSRP